MTASSANTRSRLMQLIGLGFAHPLPEFHQRLLDGSYQTSVAQATEELFDMLEPLSECRIDFIDFEAQYIDLFQVGNKGRPAVGLNAGDYAELLAGRTRPELMLDYVSWYKHFGIQTRRDEQERELPDHVVCQLEFLAWLAHLEAGASAQSELENGYRRAQRDFLQRHVMPFLEPMVQLLQRETRARGAAVFFVELGSLALDASAQTLQHLESVLRPTVTAAEKNTSAVPPVDHWS